MPFKIEIIVFLQQLHKIFHLSNNNNNKIFLNKEIQFLLCKILNNNYINHNKYLMNNSRCNNSNNSNSICINNN
jgi:hypothetical protein